jgi:hypothetical protein
LGGVAAAVAWRQLQRGGIAFQDGSGSLTVERCGGIHIHNAPKSQQEMDGTYDILLSSLIDRSRLRTEN